MGSTADIKAALAGVTAYTGAVNISDNANVEILASDINTIDTSATGTITIDKQIVLKGNSDVVQTALAAVTNTGEAKITLLAVSYTHLTLPTT